jgi:DNA-binding MarR family transcriptional regulator
MTRSPLEAIRAAMAIDRLPDGRPMPSYLSHTLVVLATYWPNIWPGQERLAHDPHTSRRNLNKRLRQLEDAGLIVRLTRDGRSTVYRLRLTGCELQGTESVIPRSPEEEEEEPLEEWGSDY